MPRARSLIAFAAAAAIPTLAHASPNFTSPTFNCSGGSLSSINWGDLITDGTIISVTPLPGALDLMQSFGCPNGTPTADLTGSSFFVNFGSFTDPTEKWADAGIKCAVKDYVITDGTLKFNVAEFDSFLPAVQDVNNNPSTVTEFVGVKMEWKYGETSPGSISWSVDPNGNLIADPLIPPSGVTVSLYGSPAVTPEPSTILLLGTGLAGLANGLRRKKK